MDQDANKDAKDESGNQMKFKIPETYRLERQEDIQDLNSDGYLLTHKKTGAKVLILQNEDNNKVFAIGFRTPPSDSTGVAHIMEHSVLCGSKHFPAKDPFVELAKGSLNTFLNAMTYPDKTIYPVASCNDADFRNLCHVYLDAVFYPNIYERPQIFAQEGWHYEIEDVKVPITINGVVYNEMRGVFSSPDDMLERELFDSLFPDTAYAFESGGDPMEIPKLTYEQFLDFHRKFYHPSNSYLYLYGNADMEERLTFIDREYLSRFERLEIDSKIDLQKPFAAPAKKQIQYSVTNEEGLEDRTYLSYASVVGTSLDRKLYLAFQIIEYALLLAPGAILNQTLLDRGIGKDISGSFECGTYQPYFSVIAKNSNLSKQEAFLTTVRDVYEKVVREGFDRKALLAAINFYEFRYREADFGNYPKGLMYGLQAFDSWLYDENEPFMHIAQNDTYRFLREQVKTDYFEKLVEKYLLNNPHAVLVTVAPERSLTTKLDAALSTELAAYKKRLSEEQLSALVQETKALKRYQEEPSTPEELETIPLLKLSDLKKEALPFTMKISDLSGVPLITHDLFTNGIGYLTLSFEITGMEEELLPYFSIFKGILGLVDTKNFTYADLFNEINLNSGGIFFSSSSYTVTDQTERLRYTFEVRSKVLYAQLPFAFRMIREVLFASDFSDRKRVKELIAMLKSRVQSTLPVSGHTTAVHRALSGYHGSSYLADLTSGVRFYRVLEELEAHFDERFDEFYAIMNGFAGKICRRNNLYIDYTSAATQIPQLEREARQFLEALPDGDYPIRDFHLKLLPEREGLKTASKVQYVAVAGDYRKAGLAYTGALKVLKVLLGYDYLWLNVRVKGGAYGCMNFFTRSGGMALVSYRDPNLEKTLEIYENTAKYLDTFEATDRDMLKYIIGAIADMDAPMTPQAEGTRALTAYFMSERFETIQKERDEVLNATTETMRDLAKFLRALNADHSVCVVGGEERIERQRALFDTVTNLL